jgi:Protein of unknown function (DUF3037)
MPDEDNRDPEHKSDNAPAAPAERTLVHRILRYVPSLLRDEWVNIGVLLYDPGTGERRLRLIEEEEEYERLRCLHPRVDEESLRGLRDHMESRFGAPTQSSGNGGPAPGTLRNDEGNPKPNATDWFKILEKWDATLSQSVQLADPKATTAGDINLEIDRLYRERVAVGQSYTAARPGRATTRDRMRDYMNQVFRQAGIWNRIQTGVRVSEFTLDGDPMVIDYGYLRNDRMRGLVQTIALSSRPDDAKVFAYTAQKIRDRAEQPKGRFSHEFVAVTDIGFKTDNENHQFLKKMLDNSGVVPLPLDGVAVWVAKLRPMVQ